MLAYLTEELVHVAALDGDVDVVRPDVIVVALRLDNKQKQMVRSKTSVRNQLYVVT